MSLQFADTIILQLVWRFSLYYAGLEVCPKCI